MKNELRDETRFPKVRSARRLVLTQSAKDNSEMTHLAFLRLTVNLYSLQLTKIFHRLKNIKLYILITIKHI